MGFVSTQHYQTPDIICHKSATAPNTTATVSAGGIVEFKWNQWVENHMGPVMTYVANCHGDCQKVDKEQLKWVKIDHGGFNEVTGKWAAVEMIANDAKWVTKVPKELVAGNYVFRHEIVAIYGKQHYPQCMSIKITGNGTESPDGVFGMEIYSIENQVDGNPYGSPLWIPGSSSSDNSTIPSPSGAVASSGTGVATATASAASSKTAAPTETAAAETALTSDAAVTSDVPSETSSAPEATPTRKSCYMKRGHAKRRHA